MSAGGDAGRALPAGDAGPPSAPADPDGYAGTARLRVGDLAVEVVVRLTGRLDPVDGRYHWAGRVGPDDRLLTRFRAGDRAASLQLPDGPATPARLGEPDPWHRLRLTGTGRPPWRHPGPDQNGE